MNKYLSQIKSQHKAAFSLNQIIDSAMIPHAFLFKGTDGVGKEFLALQFAKAIAEKFSDDTKKDFLISNIEKLNEPYIKYIYPLPRGKNETDSSGPFEKLSEEEIEIIKKELIEKSVNPFYKVNIPKTKNIKISSIRDINKFLSISFGDIKYRIILISDAHLMNEESQNALLKNLEEPPSGVIFILCTAYPERLRETIRSRCWILNFAPLSNDDIINILLKYFNVEKTIAEKVVPFANGAVTSALELIENDFEDLRERTIRILRFSFGKRFHSAFSEFSEIVENQDQTQFKLLIKMIITWLNDLHRYRNNYDEYFFSDHLETLQKFNTKFPDIELTGVTHKIDTISNSLKNNINLNTAIGNLVSELSAIIPQ